MYTIMKIKGRMGKHSNVRCYLVFLGRGGGVQKQPLLSVGGIRIWKRWQPGFADTAVDLVTSVALQSQQHTDTRLRDRGY